MPGEGDIFDRVARVTVADVVVHSDDLRISFSLRRDLKRSPNQCEVILYNLNPKTRDRITRLNPTEGSDPGIPVRIEAGYKSGRGLAVVFQGFLRTSLTTRAGGTWQTKIAGGDGEQNQAKGRVNSSLGPSARPEDILKALLKGANLGAGNLAEVAPGLKLNGGGTQTTSGVVLQGAVNQQLDNWTKSLGITWSIQNGVPQFLFGSRALGSQTYILSPGAGLVGVPVVEVDGVLSAKMKILPGIGPGVLLVLKSQAVTGNFRIDQCVWSADTRGPSWDIALKGKRF